MHFTVRSTDSSATILQTAGGGGFDPGVACARVQDGAPSTAYPVPPTAQILFSHYPALPVYRSCLNPSALAIGGGLFLIISDPGGDSVEPSRETSLTKPQPRSSRQLLLSS